MEKLPIKFKEKWIAALRSGEYKQGKFTMYDSITQTYCCLGVAEIVAGNNIETIGKTYSPRRLNRKSKVPELLKSTTSSISDILMGMNDSKDKTFNEIADWIEENL